MILGLDFGTSTTSVSRLDVTGEPSLLAIGHEGQTSIPSVLGFDADGVAHFGQEAINLYVTGVIKELERGLKNSITDNPGTLEISAGDQYLELFLRFVVKRVSEVSSLDITTDPDIEVRVSSPAGWDWQQRARLIGILSEKIGIKVADQAVVDEPSAAALTSDQVFRDGDHHKVLIFDMGGGTLDIAIMQIDPASSIPTILAADSQPIAGNKLDYRLTGIVLNKALRELGADLDAIDQRNNTEMGSLLLEAMELDVPLELFLAYLEMRVESIKRSDLAQDQDAYIRNFFAFIRARFDTVSLTRQDFDLVVTADEFRELVDDFLEPTKSWLTLLVQKASFNGKNLEEISRIDLDAASKLVSDVVVVGGMAHVYAITDWIESVFPRKLIPSFGVEPEDLVAIGLAPRTVTDSGFMAHSNFRTNFNVFLGDNLILRAYTPLFNIQRGSFDGLSYKHTPSRQQWIDIDMPTKFERRSLLGQKLSDVTGAVFHPGDLFRLFQDGIVIYPSGRLVCADGDFCNIEAFIFDETLPEQIPDSKPNNRACTACGKQSCHGTCQN